MNVRSTITPPIYQAGTEYSEALIFRFDGECAFGAIPGTWLFCAIAASAVCMAAMMIHADLGIRVNISSILYGALGCFLCAARYKFRNSVGKWPIATRDFSEYALTFATISLLGATASYAVAAGTSGWADGVVQGLDELIGFGWVAWYRFVAAHPMLQVSGMAVYASIFLTPVILLGPVDKVDSQTG